jgi:hypothetical protein
MNGRNRALFVIFVLVAGTIPACGPSQDGQIEAGGPGGAVQSFYRHLNDGAYPEAKALYTVEAREALDDPEVFGSWAEQATRKGTISKIEIVDSTVEETSATVEFEIVFDDGSKEPHTVELVDEGGQWRLGLIL